MIVAAWICLIAPLAAALAITLLGQSLSRRAAAYVASASVFGSFAAVYLLLSLALDVPEASAAVRRVRRLGRA